MGSLLYRRKVPRMTSLKDLHIAEDDRDAVENAQNVLRDHMFAALSEIRTLTIGMEPRYRDKLIDGVSKHFHPDSDYQRDNFSDALSALKIELDARVEELSPRAAE